MEEKARRIIRFCKMQSKHSPLDLIQLLELGNELERLAETFISKLYTY